MKLAWKAATVAGIVLLTAGTVFGQVKGKIDERKYLEQPKKPSIGLLKDKPFAEKPAFSEKKAPKIQLVQREDAQEAVIDGIPLARFPKGAEVAYDYSAQSKENIRLGKTTEDALGMQFENAKAYYASAKCTGSVKNGLPNKMVYFTGNAIETPFFVNGKEMFTQGQVVARDTCDWSNYPPGSDAKTSQIRMFYMQNVGPWDIKTDAGLGQAAEAIRQFAMKYGEPYIGDVLLNAPPGKAPTKWMFLSSTYLKENGALANNTPMGFGIVGIGIDDSDVFPTINQAHLGYLTVTLYASVKIWNWTDANNFEYEVRGASTGAYMLNPQGIPVPDKPCMTVQSIITSVEQIPGMPTSFSLSQNYPNPFNPATKVRFELAKSAKVSIKVYDGLGREVGTMVDNVMAPGTYEADFNGNGLASGVYFYTMSVDGQIVSSKKMALVK